MESIKISHLLVMFTAHLIKPLLLHCNHLHRINQVRKRQIQLLEIAKVQKQQILHAPYFRICYNFLNHLAYDQSKRTFPRNHYQMGV